MDYSRRLGQQHSAKLRLIRIEHHVKISRSDMIWIFSLGFNPSGEWCTYESQISRLSVKFAPVCSVSSKAVNILALQRQGYGFQLLASGQLPRLGSFSLQRHFLQTVYWISVALSFSLDAPGRLGISDTLYWGSFTHFLWQRYAHQIVRITANAQSSSSGSVILSIGWWQSVDSKPTMDGIRRIRHYAHRLTRVLWPTSLEPIWKEHEQMNQPVGHSELWDPQLPYWFIG